MIFREIFIIALEELGKTSIRIQNGTLCPSNAFFDLSLVVNDLSELLVTRRTQQLAIGVLDEPQRHDAFPDLGGVR